MQGHASHIMCLFSVVLRWFIITLSLLSVRGSLSMSDSQWTVITPCIATEPYECLCACIGPSSHRTRLPSSQGIRCRSDDVGASSSLQHLWRWRRRTTARLSLLLRGKAATEEAATSPNELATPTPSSDAKLPQSRTPMEREQQGERRRRRRRTRRRRGRKWSGEKSV